MKTGETLDGRYTIVDRIGAGGMGEVYKATHDFLGATRVIKVVRPQISGSDDAQERFLREARAAIRVRHQNVATLHDFASLPDGAHYMVWEYIEGENLSQRLRARGTLPPREAVGIVIEALHGLEAIHRAGIVHRDISPENLMVTHDGEVKIIDLGVAKLDDTDAVSQTRTGIFVGKLRYASPEQLGFLKEGERIDARTDIYALGMVLVELLTGRPPYEAKSPHEYFLLHAREEQRKTIALPAGLPGGEPLQVVVEKALARDRNERFGSAREFAERLEALLPSLPATARPHADDATIGVATPQSTRETLRTPSQIAETIRTPVPGEGTARTLSATAVTDADETARQAPPQLAAAANTAKRRSLMAAGVAAVVLVATLVGAGLLLQRRRGSAVPAASAPAQIAQVAPPVTPVPRPSVPAGTALTVTEGESATASPSPLPPAERRETAEKPRARSVTPPAEPLPDTAKESAVADEAVPEPSEEGPLRAALGPVYVDGGPDEDANDRALGAARRALAGVTEVELHAGPMRDAVVAALKEELPALRVVDRAAVVIRFDGILARMGRGRKRRAATVAVLKDHRIVLRYVLPDEVYRVGMTPPEAFARVFAHAVDE